MKHLLTILMATFLGAAPLLADERPLERADETWPLRLAGGGDEVWPLRFFGEAATISGVPVRTVDTSIVLQYVNGRVMLPNQANRLQCTMQGAQVQKHEARGTVTIGGIAHQIAGMCYDRASDNLEIVAQRQADRANLSGPLPSRAGTPFRGRLQVAGTPERAGRYTFTVRIQRNQRGGDGSIPLDETPDR